MNDKFVKDSLLPDEKILATAKFHPFRNIIIPAIFAIVALVIGYSLQDDFNYRIDMCKYCYTGNHYPNYFWDGEDKQIIHNHDNISECVGHVSTTSEFVKYMKSQFSYFNYLYFDEWDRKDLHNVNYGSLFLFFIISIVVCGGTYWFIAFLNGKDEFVITNKRVIAKVGFIRRTAFELQSEQVESIEIHQGILGRVLNYGTVIPCGVGSSKVRVCFIENPFEFRQHFYNLKNNTSASTKEETKQAKKTKWVIVVIPLLIYLIALLNLIIIIIQ